MRQAIENRFFVSFVLASSVGLASALLPFPSQMLCCPNSSPQFLRVRRTTLDLHGPHDAVCGEFERALVRIHFIVKQETTAHRDKAASYPAPGARKELFVIIGEVHQPKRREPRHRPSGWPFPNAGSTPALPCSERSGAGRPVVACTRSLSRFSSSQRTMRTGAQPGWFWRSRATSVTRSGRCSRACGRAGDYLEISLDGKYRYNPLHNDLEAYALAYGIASLLNNLFGKGKEPFWQQAYTNLVKFIILLHKTLYEYVTLFDVYECAINQNLLAQRIADGEQILAARYLLVDVDTYLERTDLDEFEWERDDNAQCMKSPYLKERAHLVSKGIAFDLLSSAGEDMWDALRMWLESVVTTNLRLRTHSRLSSRISPVDTLWDSPSSRDGAVRGDARPPVAGHSRAFLIASRKSMSGSGPGSAFVEAVEAGPGNPAQLHHAFDRQSASGLHFFLDLPVDGGFPVNACSIRCSSMRCKHPFKKSISRACWPILRSSSAMRPSAQRCFPWPGNTLPGPWRNSRRQRCSTLGFTSNARATSPIETPRSSRCTAASLNSFVNILLDNPMTQFSFEWILSLNWLCQKWGQVQGDPLSASTLNGSMSSSRSPRSWFFILSAFARDENHPQDAGVLCDEH